MASPNRAGGQAAARHETEAGNYRREAIFIHERNVHLASAGALLYEAAKQCINAVANRNGINPGTTGAKLQALRNIAEQGYSPTDLMRNWQAAAKLHIHADRGHLDGREFEDAWTGAQSFIDQMLLIYASRQ